MQGMVDALLAMKVILPRTEAMKLADIAALDDGAQKEPVAADAPAVAPSAPS